MATPGDKPPPAAAPAAAPTITTTPVPAPASSALASGTPEGTIRWQGPVTFREEFGTSTDLDKVSPRTTTVDEEGDVHAGGVNAMEEAKGPVTENANAS